MTTTIKQNSKEHQIIKCGYEHTVYISDSGDYGHYSKKKVNPKTGKGWQKSQNDKIFRGKNAGAKAMWHMTKELNKK